MDLAIIVSVIGLLVTVIGWYVPYRRQARLRSLEVLEKQQREIIPLVIRVKFIIGSMMTRMKLDEMSDTEEAEEETQEKIALILKELDSAMKLVNELKAKYDFIRLHIRLKFRQELDQPIERITEYIETGGKSASWTEILVDVLMFPQKLEDTIAAELEYLHFKYFF